MRTLALPLLFALAVPAAGSSPDPKRLAVPPEDMLKAQELVRQLGSDDFPVRESAHDRLAKMGRLAKPALGTALASNPDPEVRSRCRELMPRAAAADLKARLATFLADTDGKFEHDLSRWNEFQAVEYGFAEQFRGPSVSYTYSARNLPEAARAAAFEKLKAWRAKNPDWGGEKR